ncbi:MAG: hypothetical protein WC551_01675 [Patescibacteria group bacterium]
MKIWVAYQFTGADLDVLKSTLGQLRRQLEARGHVMVTMVEDIQEWDVRGLPKDELVRRMFPLMETCDMALCIYPDQQASDGRGYDAGYFIGRGKPVVMAIHGSLKKPFQEALFSQAPPNKELDWSVIRYLSFQDIADCLPEVQP